MRVAKVDGLVTLFYDGSRELFNRQLHDEWWDEYLDHDEKIKGWESWDLSDECKQYLRQRFSWQQVIIEEGVTVIPDGTFRNCKSIKRVIFADTVVRIEQWAFANCEGLVYIKLSINLEYIGRCTFASCNLSSVFLPPRCRQVGFAAFDYNKNLTICHVPQDTELGAKVFAQTKFIANSPFGDEVGQYDHAHEEVHNWIKTSTMTKNMLYTELAATFSLQNNSFLPSSKKKKSELSK